MVSARVLSVARRQHDRLLSSRATIFERETLQDAEGVPRQDMFRVVASDVPCRVVSAGGESDFLTQGESDFDLDAYRIIFAAARALSPGMRIRVSGIPYEVLGIADGATQRLETTVEVRRVRDD